MSDTLELDTPPQFDWPRLLTLAGRGGADWVNRTVDETFTRLFTSGAGHVLVTCLMKNGKLRLTVASGSDTQPAAPRIAELGKLVRHLFSLDASWPAVQSVLRRDPLLQPHVDARSDFRPLRTPSLFEALVDALLGQQVHRELARRLRNRLVEDFGASRRVAGQVYYAFPTPARLARATVELLREAQLSARKAEYMLGLARRFCRPVTLPGEPERDLRLLMRLPGIGPWSAAYAAMQGTGADDLVPAGDAYLQSVLGRLHGFEGPADEATVRRVAERWRPYRSWGTHLVWYGLSPETAEREVA
jgi:DNA-3-methyladenine glycosylase II